jgi:CBS-domain-containing membrane protein
MSWIRGLVTLRQPFPGWRRIALAGIGGAIVIAVLAAVTELSGSVLLAGSFGATCVLVFSLPEAPVSQPVNVVAGHLLTTTCGLVALTLLPVTWWSIALAVGVSIAAMAALRVTHPPAGANPIVVMTAGATWGYLLFPMLVGAVVIVVIGLVFHRLTGTAYPARLPAPVPAPVRTSEKV